MDVHKELLFVIATVTQQIFFLIYWILWWTNTQYVLNILCVRCYTVYFTYFPPLFPLHVSKQRERGDWANNQGHMMDKVSALTSWL